MDDTYVTINTGVTLLFIVSYESSLYIYIYIYIVLCCQMTSESKVHFGPEPFISNLLKHVQGQGVHARTCLKRKRFMPEHV